MSLLKVVFLVSIWISVVSLASASSSTDSNRIKTQYSCEHNELYISCNKGSGILIIKAVYGRLTTDLCNDDGQVLWSGDDCMSHRSLDIMIDRCEHKQSCSVRASNGNFGDPCSGTVKYLEVQYYCLQYSDSKTTTINSYSTSEFELVSGTSIENHNLQTIHSCEHNELHIDCKKGYVIHIILANYGRSTRHLCNDDGNVVWSGEPCVSGISYSIIKNRCEQKQSCAVSASNAVFLDPCRGTIKYLEVNYICAAWTTKATSVSTTFISTVWVIICTLVGVIIC